MHTLTLVNVSFYLLIVLKIVCSFCLRLKTETTDIFVEKSIYAVIF